MKNQNVMKMVAILMVGMGLVGCATKRTKYTDPAMRVMVDPKSVDKLNLARVQKALMDSGNWTIVDRGDAYEAMNREQDRQFKDADNRIGDRERYAVWGRQFGVGGIVIAKTQCGPSQRFWSSQGDMDCVQTLQVVDAMTGEILAMIDHMATDAVFFYGEIRTAPSWEDAVDKLNSAFPSHFKRVTKTKTILEREYMADQASQQMREAASEKEEGQ